jgi:peptidyl-tRNA hydrolase, PTH1 family
MLLLAGLGNPGAKYAHHRHNIGFMAVDEIARVQGFTSARKRFASELMVGSIGGEKILLLKPQTFMNESGRALGQAMRFFKLTPEDIYVFYDEIDLEPGKIRFKTGGGAAGHNGIKSIISHIGPDFHRIRLGVGHPGHKDRVHGYVLKDFSRTDHEWLDDLISALGQNIETLITLEPSTFLNRVHLTLHPEPKKPNTKKPEQDNTNGL